tara:strand:- start:15 stop:281 length:267 start_codon:yes stop_codon:yes gene_type:complete
MPFTKADPNINRNGRPPNEMAISNRLRDIASEIDPKTKKEKIVLVCETAFELAIQGDPQARNWISDRMEGKAKEFIEQKIIKDELIIE